MKNIFSVLWLTFMLSCNSAPSGNLTIIESKVINSETGSPYQGKIFLLEECNSLSWAGEICSVADTLVSDENGMIEYAFFHSENYYYLLTTQAEEDLICSEEIRVSGGSFVKDIIELTPLEPMLKVTIKKSNVAADIRLNVFSQLECATAYSGSRKSFLFDNMDQDTSVWFQLPILDTVVLFFDKISIDRSEIISGDTTIFLSEEVQEIIL